jgi:hypothetical protein
MENLHVQIEERINGMVGDVLVLIRRAANDAINQALSGVGAVEPSRARQTRSQRRTSPAKPYVRRSAEELTNLCDRLYQQIEQRPGEAMAVHAEALSIAARDLGVVMRRLKTLGRVRSVGERDRTRYFPMDPA